MKHIIGKLEDVAVGGEVVVKLNLQCYHVKVVDLLVWTPPQENRSAGRKQNKYVKFKNLWGDSAP